ncbi:MULTISPECIES: CcmD family protein [unclassified Mucilaginibacter]|uniref:CcmD family protein n=1 Tax=unclassified Mucilaginibacter TaxID=2617802 RepID=UPI002AC9A581|nr:MULTISPECIES: CcmD family protein [unclassified Mucilaginibacter]MEB0262984.1 CcmD family protein [Mucilaginibacter sp. 10I4]MEB0280288.1 CcmD family protein [Mucilaginibacter sp. 10B2]MEB0300233.1 CcmD family protein [Mucilaginibacter sp. 5C4]WPX25590.1 CcmD family protein [Mucilaginibacter sp. 5C4]
MKRIVSLILMMLCFVAVKAQNVEMADKMRSEGKIYVVIGTIVIVFAGLAVYLFTIDRRLKKIEKEN